MIPDTMAGGLLLSVVNMAVVFLVLGFLAVLINFIAKAVNAGSSRKGGGDGLKEDSREDSELDSSSDQENVSFAVPTDVDGEPSLDPKIKAAICAAISAFYDDGASVSVFVRKVKDSGAWGKSFRNYSAGGLLRSR